MSKDAYELAEEAIDWIDEFLIPRAQQVMDAINTDGSRQRAILRDLFVAREKLVVRKMEDTEAAAIDDAADRAIDDRKLDGREAFDLGDKPGVY